MEIDTYSALEEVGEEKAVVVEKMERGKRMAHVNFTHRFGDKCTLMLGKDDDVFLSVGEDPEDRQVSILSLKAMREFISEVDKDE